MAEESARAGSDRYVCLHMQVFNQSTRACDFIHWTISLLRAAELERAENVAVYTLRLKHRTLTAV